MLGKFEPVFNAYTISTLVAAVITVAVAFNVPITEDQRNALLGLVAAVCAIFFGGAVLARNNVVPVAKVERIESEAKAVGAQKVVEQLVASGQLPAQGTQAVVPNPTGYMRGVF